MRVIKITNNGHGSKEWLTYTHIVDEKSGVEISSAVHRIDYTHTVGEIPQATVHVHAGKLEVIAAAEFVVAQPEPINMLLFCPACHRQHVDAPNDLMDWHNPPHRSHLCAYCNLVWRPADVCTNGVEATETRGKNDTYSGFPHTSTSTSNGDPMTTF